MFPTIWALWDPRNVSTDVPRKEFRFLWFFLPLSSSSSFSWLFRICLSVSLCSVTLLMFASYFDSGAIDSCRFWLIKCFCCDVFSFQYCKFNLYSPFLTSDGSFCSCWFPNWLDGQRSFSVLSICWQRHVVQGFYLYWNVNLLDEFQFCFVLEIEWFRGAKLPIVFCILKFC